MFNKINADKEKSLNFIISTATNDFRKLSQRCGIFLA